jgi:hypothetical protein
MKMDRVRAVGLTAVVLIVLVFSMLVVTYEFPAFDYADPSPELIEVETTMIGLEVSRFLWTYRLVDLIAQAFVLFAAAACCVAILRLEEEKK